MIVSEASNFPTDLYIAEGLAELLQQGYSLRLVNSPDELPQAIDADVAVVHAHPRQLQDRLHV